MHYPVQTNRTTKLNTGLLLKFTGGFGIDSDRIGLLFMLYGIVGVFIQFLIFPPLARRLGVLNCLKFVSILFPVAYLITPFTALFTTPLTQQAAIFGVMLIKCWAVIFAFPCTTILLTNSATSLRILGTLNGIAVSVSALGRAAGPAIGGWTFTLGLDVGYGILPWWTLAALAIFAAMPVWWLVEMEGFGNGTGGANAVDERDQDAAQGRASATETGSNPGTETEEWPNDDDHAALDPLQFGTSTATAAELR